ncbi:glycosyltransferase family 2 protein [Robiginitalea sp. IMCC43444]|uniref:glycosyltransferase family 2 protein n=1 Tax=Robiginitalea sp. IMCC43444 TaxID=3459121 RepID=UPI004042A3C6
MMNGKAPADLLLIIPAHNEAALISQCLDSILSQSRLPDQVLVVDDHSTDNTAAIVDAYSKKYPWIQLLQKKSTPAHQPGGKIVDTFNFGLSHISKPYRYIGKFDADIVLPTEYLQKVLNTFEKNPALGMCSGLLYIEKQGGWVYEQISGAGHVRGPLKLYSKACFEAIGGLRPHIGWDTADTLLARYHGFEVQTLPELRVRHLRPTGSSYTARQGRLQGRSFYNLRYGLLISVIASLKLSWKLGKPFLSWHHFRGYFKAWQKSEKRLLSPDEGRFARKYRWAEIRKKLF